MFQRLLTRLRGPLVMCSLSRKYKWLLFKSVYNSLFQVFINFSSKLTCLHFSSEVSLFYCVNAKYVFVSKNSQ